MAEPAAGEGHLGHQEPATVKDTYHHFHYQLNLWDQEIRKLHEAQDFIFEYLDKKDKDIRDLRETIKHHKE